MDGSSEATAEAETNAPVTPRLHSPAFGSVTAAQLFILGLALFLLFRFNLIRLWQLTNPTSGDPNWGHAIFIPLVSLAYLYLHRDDLSRACIRPTFFGLIFIALGFAVFTYGICMWSSLPHISAYVQDLGMFVTLFGSILAIFGWQVMKVAFFPIAYLLCALPWPPYVHDRMTTPLQQFAATASVEILQSIGMNVEKMGNTIHILSMSSPERVLNVADACSGMRSLITFIAVGLGVAFLSQRPLWQKIIISLSAIPIAIACNVMRIVGEGVIDRYVSRELSQGFAHSFIGVILLVPGFLLFLLVGPLLDRIVVADAAAKPKQDLSPPASTSIGDAKNDRLRGSAIGFRRMYFSVIAILFLAAGGFAVTTNVLQLHFQKIAVPLVLPLSHVPADLGPWHQVAADQPLPADMEEALGTRQYIFREYLDERVLGSASIARLRLIPPSGPTAGAIVSQEHPDAVVHLGVTYYTGHVAATVHVPEKCYVGHGLASSVESVPATFTLAGGRRRNVQIVRLDAEDVGSHNVRFLAYCYRVNGREESTAVGVRRGLADVFERYAWFAKVEILSPVGERGAAEKILTDFLSNALPEIEGCLPIAATHLKSPPGADSAASLQASLHQ